MKRALLVATIALLSPATARAADDRSARDLDRLGWYVPDFVRLQTGGYTGLVNVGVGYAAFNDVLNWSIGYGYTPPFTAERHVHSIDTTFSIRPIDVRYRDLRVVPIYLGGGLLFGLGEGYFLMTPKRYHEFSRTYYPPTAVHWTAHLGAEVDWLPKTTFFERHGMFVEVRTLDTFFVSYLENPKTLGLGDALSLGFGYRAAF
jgi:hypothetical protein